MELTNEFIANLPKPQVEFRSEKKFLETISDNYLNRDWKIIGWVTNKTLKRWGVVLNNNPFLKEREEKKYWVLCKGNNYWYVACSLKY